ncbi:MAG: response regulator [Bdellovibrionota bacterium]
MHFGLSKPGNNGNKLPFTLSRQFAVLVGVAGVVITVLLANSIREMEQKKIREETGLQETIVQLEIKRRLEERVRAIDRLVKRWELWGRPARAHWEAEANLYIHGHEGYQSIGWVDRSFHLRWLVPIEGNEPSLNLDMRFEPARKTALESAMRDHETTMTAPIDLVEGGLGFRVVIPIYRNGHFEGFVVSAFRSALLFNQILHPNISAGYGIRLEDASTTIFSRQAQSEPQPKWIMRSAFNILHREWRLTIWPEEQILAHSASYASAVLFSGIIISILCGWLVHFAQGAWFRRHAELESHFKTEFLANMSHEIRTPLSAVIGYAEALALPGQRLSDEARQDFVSRIRNNANFLGGLIDDVLDITRVESGRIIVETRMFSLEALLLDIHEMYRAAMKDRRVKLEIAILGNVPTTIASDAKRMRQVLTNLVSNAFKFTHEGKVRIRVEMRPNPKNIEGRELCFYVTDTGAGISPADQTRIFLPLERGVSSNLGKVGGAGIGLALSRKLARCLSGDLVLLGSEVGKGSEFLFTCCVRRFGPEFINTEAFNTNLMNPPSEASRLSLPDDLRGLSILSVEDDADIQNLIRHYLNLAGINCACAKNGIEGVEKALRGNFDLILMDVQMPLLDGNESIRKLRQVGCNTPIVSLTARVMRGETQTVLDSGASACLAKPFTFDQLVAIIRQHCRRRPHSASTARVERNDGEPRSL